LQIGNPELLTVVALINFKTKARAEAVEKQLHKMFKRSNIRGEWFENTIELRRADDFFNNQLSGQQTFFDQENEKLEMKAGELVELSILENARSFI